MDPADFLTTPFFLTVVMTGAIFVIAGAAMNRYPPKDINSLYGYRSKSSMKSQERWDFAQKFSGKAMFSTGILLALSGLLTPFIPYMYGIWISLTLIVLAAIILISTTEKAISRGFD